MRTRRAPTWRRLSVASSTPRERGGREKASATAAAAAAAARLQSPSETSWDAGAAEKLIVMSSNGSMDPDEVSAVGTDDARRLRREAQHTPSSGGLAPVTADSPQELAPCIQLALVRVAPASKGLSLSRSRWD
jgi:hypothetical protein